MAKITISYGETINTGNFENIKLNIEVETSLDDSILDNQFELNRKVEELYTKAIKALDNQKQKLEESVEKTNITPEIRW